MKNVSSVLLISALAFNYSCTTTMKINDIKQEIPVPDASLSSNPFMKKSKLQYEAPEFDKIKNEHFKPAFEFGLNSFNFVSITIFNMASSQQQRLNEEELEVMDEVALESKLIVHNDEVNTFDFVAETLVDVCKHSWEQAEQCTYIIHHKGKYAVKHGNIIRLRSMKDAITERGISATIE